MAYWIGKNTTISQGSTQITQVRSITPPALEMGEVETTHLESEMRENMPTIVDPGQCSFTIEYDPADASHQGLYTAFLAGTISTYTIVMTKGDATVTISFSAFIQNFGIDELSVDSVNTIPVTLMISGETTITYDDGEA